MIRYEVTVPLVVTVDVNDESVWETEVVAVEISTDWGGFFSEAEEAYGIWNVDGNEWEYQHDVFHAARDAARKALGR